MFNTHTLEGLLENGLWYNTAELVPDFKVRNMAVTLARQGCAVAVLNMRGCAGSPLLTARGFSGMRGSTDDVRVAVRYAREVLLIVQHIILAVVIIIRMIRRRHTRKTTAIDRHRQRWGGPPRRRARGRGRAGAPRGLEPRGWHRLERAGRAEHRSRQSEGGMMRLEALI